MGRPQKQDREGVENPKTGDVGDDTRVPKRQRTDENHAGTNAARSGNTGLVVPAPPRGNIFDDDNIASTNAPGPEPSLPEPLPTGPRNIGCAVDSPIVLESDSSSYIGSIGSGHEIEDDSAEPRRLGRQALLARIQEAKARLDGLVTNHQPCDCPWICPGHDNRDQAQSRPFGHRLERPRGPRLSDADLPPLEPTPAEGHIDETRIRSITVAKAEGTRVVDMPRLGPVGTQARLRMSLQVHEDPYGYRTRLGYYGDLYLTPESDPRERAAGYISAWRISKPNARHPHLNPQTWADEWLRSPLVQDRVTAEDVDVESMKSLLRRLYDQDGQPRPNSQHLTANRLELGDHGNDVVLISMVLIYHEYTGNGLFQQGKELFYSLCTNGTLPEWYNMSGPITFILETGIPTADVMSEIWFRNYPRQEGEAEDEYLDRLQRILVAHYRKHGYVDYDTTPEHNIIMGRVIVPRERQQTDRLLPRPKAPELPEFS